MKFATPTTTLSALCVAVTLAMIPAASSYADANQNKWQQLFDQLDLDKDGLLSQAEYEHATSKQVTSQSKTQASGSAQPSPLAQSQIPSQQAQSQIPSQQAQSGSPYIVMLPNPYLSQPPFGGSPYYGVPQPYGMPQAYGGHGGQQAFGGQQPYAGQQAYGRPQAGYPQMPYMYPQMAQGQSPWMSGYSQQGGQLSFDMLDVDRNGYLTSLEAFGSYPLMQHWSRIDTNRDGVIERSEFSAFESSQGR